MSATVVGPTITRSELHHFYRRDLFNKTDASVYASPKVAKALEDVLEKANLYEGVKIGQILEAVYKQGRKDGARDAFSEIDRGVKAARTAVPHVNPGRPKKQA